MTNVFKDIDKFAVACDQAPSEDNYLLYLNLIAEEYGELVDATAYGNKVGQLDTLVDI